MKGGGRKMSRCLSHFWLGADIKQALPLKTFEVRNDIE